MSTSKQVAVALGICGVFGIVGGVALFVLPLGARTNSSPPPAAATPATPAATGPRATFGDGTWLVGTDITPGQYRTTVPATSDGCYWVRLKGTSGAVSDIIGNGSGQTGTPVVVTIVGTDAAFNARGCGTWQRIG
jgi:hypothetical protein